MQQTGRTHSGSVVVGARLGDEEWVKRRLRGKEPGDSAAGAACSDGVPLDSNDGDTVRRAGGVNAGARLATLAWAGAIAAALERPALPFKRRRLRGDGEALLGGGLSMASLLARWCLHRDGSAAGVLASA